MLLSLAAVAGISSGCSEKEPSESLPNSNNNVTITVWHYYSGVQQEYFDNMVSEFNETVGKDRNITVISENHGTISELSERVLASLGGENDKCPDMFTAYSETAFLADKPGRVVNLKEYFTDEELSEYIEGYLSEGELSDGELKIFPTAKSTEVMLINITDWNKFAEAEGASLDDLSTWEKLCVTAEKYYNYTDAFTPFIPNDGKALFGRDAMGNYMVVGAKQLGFDFVETSDSGFEVTPDKNSVRKLWDCYYVPYVKGYFYSKNRFRSDDAKDGSIIAAVCSTTGAAYFPQEITKENDGSYPIEVEALPVPVFEGCEKYITQQGAGMVVVKSNAQKESACALFLKWITEKERNIEFSANSGYLPVKKAANSYEEISKLHQSDKPESPLQKAIKVAVGEISDGKPYAMKPFEKSTELRGFLESFIQQTAESAYNTASERISKGEERHIVLEELTGDEAFETWYAEFLNGLKASVGK